MRLTKDLLSGLMFCGFGIGAAVVAQDYNLGSLSRMGSGFFPTVLGTGLGPARPAPRRLRVSRHTPGRADRRPGDPGPGPPARPRRWPR